MIEVLPERNEAVLKQLYARSNISYKEGRIASVAKAGAEMLGYCLFELEGEKITVLYLWPENDILLADGILRSSLHVGVVAGVKKAYFEPTAPTALFRELKFIGDEENSLKIEKLFESCCGGCSK